MKNLTRRNNVLLSVIVIAATLIIFFANTHRIKEFKTRSFRAVNRQWLILSGQLIDVGGYRLKLICKGEGSPTVIMDAGLNMTTESWGTVAGETAKFTRVCVYDRAGLGDSDRAQKPRTSRQIVSDLNKLLQIAGEDPPFILVGHSFGGINMRMYASTYPQSAAGLVLIDASYEDEYQRYAELKPVAKREDYLRHEGGDNFEGVNLLASADELRLSGALPKIPVIVLSAKQKSPLTEDLPQIKAHDEMQAELARSTAGQLVVVSDSGHFIQLDQPDVVIDSIRKIYESTRK
jgi:pimeloyl-ACP methyl ester carboxylesterase